MRHSSGMPKIAEPDPPGLTPIITRPEALAAGMTRDEVRHRLRSGRWRALAPGLYLREPLGGDDPFEVARQAYVLEAVAAARRIEGSAVAYGSAALMHGMELASGVPRRRELVVPPGAWNGIRGGVRVRLADLGANEVNATGEVPVTVPARTWVDVARSSPLADALSVGDSALRLGLATPQALRATLDHHPAARGLKRAAHALELLSPLRENPLESRAFAWFVEAGLPLPECQVEIWDGHGFIGRVDFLWRWARLIAEADGRLKYMDPDALYAEKRREDRLRADGYDVIRFGWWDLDDELRRRFESRLSQAA